MDRRPDFYLASTEGYNLEQPRASFVLRTLKSNTGEDMLLVQVVPSIPHRCPDGTMEDLDTVVLAPRYRDTDLRRPDKWPVHVHVARVNVGDTLKSVLGPHEFVLIAWAQLYTSAEDAAAAVRRVHGD